MTRKRFVKQLMSLGMQRNEANVVAIRCNSNGVPYRKALVPETTKYNLRKVAKAFLSFGQSMKQATESFKAMAEVLKNESRTS